jgi:aspartyl-tRNA(Asn)/glutamyl-tRNA(Gln) amidotransferase subunit C
MLASAMPGEREDFPIARVAALARLRISPSEAALYQAQLTQILELVGRVSAEVPESPAPDERGARVEGAERPDTVGPSLAVEAALANAPDVSGPPRLVRVPKVIG